MYLTYTEYQSMGGTLVESIFNSYEFEAESLINYATFNRLTNETTVPIKVKKLTFYIIDMVQKKAESLSLGSGNSVAVSPYITSQSNDGVSVTYSGMASSDLFTLCEKEIQRAIKTQLYDVKNSLGRNLLYRGLYDGE